MSRTLFRFEIPQAVQDENLDGRELTRRGFAVSKFAAQSTTPTIVTDNAADIEDGAVIEIDEDNRTIIFRNTDTPLAEGNITFIGWKIIVGDGTTTGNLHVPDGQANTNYNFYNCNIELRNLDTLTNETGDSFGVGYSYTTAPTRAINEYEDTAAASRGINSYGCLWVYSRDPQRPVRFADFVDSEFIFLSGTGNFDSSGGGRHIRSTLNAYGNDDSVVIRAYGQTIVENTIYNNFAFGHGNTGSDQPEELVLDRPLFLPTGSAGGTNNAPLQTSIVLLNAGTGTNRPVQLIGGPSIGNSVADSFGPVEATIGPSVIGTNGLISMHLLERGRSGLIQYYGVGDRFFTDGTLTTGAPGIRVRLNSDINPATVTSTLGNPGARRFSALGPNFIEGTTSIIGQTNENGMLATFQWFDSSRPTTNQTGYVNWWGWEDASDTGRTVWATNQDQTTSPEGMMLIPIATAYISAGSGNPGVDADRRFDNITISEQRRAFAWDVNQPLTNITRPDVRQELVVPSGSLVPQSVVGTRVKAAYVTNGLPNASLAAAFPGTATTVSLNDIDNAFRDIWFNFRTDQTPDEQTANLTDNYSLTLDSTSGDAYNVLNTGTDAIITVRANGIAPKSDDLFDTRRFDIVTLNQNPVEGQNIIANTINDARRGTTRQDFAFRNCTLSGTLNVQDFPYVFDRVDLSNVDLVQTSGSNSTTIRGTDQDGNVLSATNQGFRSITPNTGDGGTVDFGTLPFTLTVAPEVSEQDLQDRRGYWRVYSNTGDELQSVDITESTTLADVTFEFSSAGGNDVMAWYQPLATIGGFAASYGYRRIVPGDATGDTNYFVQAQDRSALVSSTAIDRTSMLTISTAGSGASQTINVIIDIDNNITEIMSQEIALAIINNINYIETVVTRMVNGDENMRVIDFTQPFITVYNGGEDEMQQPINPVINLTADATAPIGIANTTGYVSNPEPGNFRIFDTSVIQQIATIAEVTEAIGEVGAIQQVNNKTSYLVTNGAATNAPTTGSRLTGIAPKRADYDPDNNYTANTTPTS